LATGDHFSAKKDFGTRQLRKPPPLPSGQNTSGYFSPYLQCAGAPLGNTSGTSTPEEIMFNRLRHPGISLFLAAALCACATPPANLDMSLQKTSAAGRYVVSVAPPLAQPGINQMHSWTVNVKDTGGSPVTGAKLAVDGGMPQHGHGLPTRPRVTREIESGTYLVEGVKFSMPGWWNIKFDIQSALGQDKVSFNTVVAPASARR
jgi:hypothetical protein